MKRNQKVIAIWVAVGFTLGLITTFITKQAGEAAVIAVAGGVVAATARFFMVRGQKK